MPPHQPSVGRGAKRGQKLMQNTECKLGVELACR